MIPNQDKCGFTTWNYIHDINKYTIELVNHGQIKASDEFVKAKADRLSVTADCSLVINKVSVEDAGQYTCQQFIKRKEREEQHGPDALVYLSLVNSEY